MALSNNHLLNDAYIRLTDLYMTVKIEIKF